MGIERRWTVAEANAALPWVTERLEAARSLLAAARERAGNTVVMVRTNGHGSLPADLTPVREVVDELNREGIVVRDLDRGLIDFPAETAGGRTYLLCWLLGEAEVAWWHWPEDGFAGRAPLDTPPG
jgi:hypothetical protein